MTNHFFHERWETSHILFLENRRILTKNDLSLYGDISKTKKDIPNLISCKRACERSEQTTGEALVYIINKIRMSVRPSVCLSVYLRLLIGARYVGKLYMVRSEISRGRFLSMFRSEPTTLPDAIVRKADTGRKKRQKIVVFSRFSRY